MSTHSTLEDLLRQALNHLYDSVALRDSPLVSVLGLEAHPNKARALRTTLETAIEAVGDLERSTAGCSTERNYDVLSLRYLQQFTQAEVANQLGVSTRHLRREQARALQVLADYLSEKYHLPDRMPVGAGPSATEEGDSQLDRELHWLEDSLAEGSVQVNPLLDEALQTARPLAAAHGVSLGRGASEGLPQAAIDATLLKQAILNLLATAIQAAPGGAVSTMVRSEEDRVIIELTARPSVTSALQRWTWDEAKVDIARRLVEPCGGEVSIRQANNALAFSTSLPSVAQVLVLVIEDNVDTLQLLQRYLEHTRFQVMTVSDPRRTLQVAEARQPQIILLDVMMPGVDGWDLLTRLRHQPATAHIPVVVCTVLPQPELALSLGAAGFLPKPTTRKALIEALTRQNGA